MLCASHLPRTRLLISISTDNCFHPIQLQGDNITTNNYSRAGYRLHGNFLYFCNMKRLVINKTNFSNQVNAIINKLKPHRKVKPIKKNTLRRKRKALELRLDRRQQERPSIPLNDNTMRVCSNCGGEYEGRYCPQCGQAGTWSRYTWRQVLLNVLDIWGLGNRPMFRTIKELFWRPGYMIRDYLEGHRQSYFPPFKLLAVTVILMLFSYWLTGQNYESVLFNWLHEDILDNMDQYVEKFHLSPIMAMVATMGIKFGILLGENPLYELLFISTFFVCCIWVAFRNVKNYNFVETFIFFIFVMSQMNLFTIINTFLTGIWGGIQTHLFTPQMLSIDAMKPVFGLLSILAILISTVFVLIRLFVIIMDFRQFYGLWLKPTIWRIFLAAMIGLFTIGGTIVTSLLIYNDKYEVLLILGIVLFLLLGVYLVFSRYLKVNKNHLNRVIYLTTKVMMITAHLVVLLVFLNFISDIEEPELTNILGAFIKSCIDFAVLLLFCVSPILLYKRFKNTWIALIPAALLIILFIMAYYWGWLSYFEPVE